MGWWWRTGSAWFSSLSLSRSVSEWERVLAVTPSSTFWQIFSSFFVSFFLIVFRVKTKERYCDSDQVCIVVVAVPMARINGVIIDGNNWIVKWGPRIQTSDVCTNITRNQKKCPIVAARPSVELIYMKTKPITAGEGCPLTSVFFISYTVYSLFSSKVSKMAKVWLQW